MTDEIVLTKTLRDQGFDTKDLARLSRSGELARVRRGAYAYAPDDDQTREKRHRRLVLATASQLLDGSVVSHGSAAVLHGLPVWRSAIEKVHVTCDRSGRGKCRSVVHVHGAPLSATDITVRDGVVVTSIARTVLDLGRTRPMEQSVAAGDVALRLGLSPPRSASGCSPWNAGPAYAPPAGPSTSSTPGARAPASPSAGFGCTWTDCLLRISRSRSWVPTER